MVKEINWNTALVVLIIGVVGFLLLSNSGIFTGLLTYSITTKEIVTCVFENSKTEEKCHGTSESPPGYSFSCAGVSSCNARVEGKKGTKLRWTPSCAYEGKSQVTVIDGKNEKVVFTCESPPEPKIIANACDADNTCEVRGLQLKEVSLFPARSSTVAYACFDKDNNLVRSNNPCVKAPVCHEGDGGRDYLVKGETCLGEDCKTDICSEKRPEYLLEYYCDGKTDRSSEEYKCPNGCKDGACLRKD